MKKGKQPLLYLLGSVLSWVVDVGGFYVLNLLLRGVLGTAVGPVCNVLARVVSSFFNYNYNYLVVFDRGQPYGKAMFRYYCLAVPVLLVSTFSLTMITRLLNISSPNGATAVKVVVDGLLYVVNFFIQKYWVFRKKEPTPDTRAEE